METLSDFWRHGGFIPLSALCIFVIYCQFRAIEERQIVKLKFKVLYQFYDFVSNCKINKSSKAYIEQRLKLVRAEAMMENAEFCNLVDEITTCYYNRFGV